MVLDISDRIDENAYFGFFAGIPERGINKTLSAYKEFEEFMRQVLPLKLNLSPSKQIACNAEFQDFSGIVKALSEKAPKEFEDFLSDLKVCVDRVARWKCPRTHQIVAKRIQHQEGETDGRSGYLMKKKQWNRPY